MKHFRIAERFYSEWNPGEPSPDDLKELALNWRDALLNSSIGDEEHRMRIAEALDGCEPRNRCLSAACPMCGMAAKHLLTRQVDILWPKPVPLRSYTLVAPYFQRPLGSLDSVDFHSIREFTSYWLDAAGFGDLKALGFIDLSHSIDHRIQREEWTPHIHMLTPVKGSFGLSEALNKIEKPTETIAFPAKGALVKNRSYQVSYVFKPRPTRTVRYAIFSVKAKPNKYWLKPRERVEALLWLGRHNALERSVPINLDHFADLSRVD